MGLMNDAEEFAGDVGQGLMGAGGMLGEFLLAAKAPAMYRHMMNERSDANELIRQREWANNMPNMQAENLMPDAFNNEESQVMQQLDPSTNSFKNGATATEMARYMATSPHAAYRQAGAGLVSQNFRPTAQRPKFTNIDRGARGNAYGINQQGQQVKLDGVAIPQKQNTPMVQNIIRNGAGDQKPKAPQGMQTVWDDTIGNWRFKPVAGSQFDKKGAANVMKETASFNEKDFVYNDVISKIDNYAKIQSEFGNVMNPMSREGKLLAQAQVQVLMGLKEALNLGVLSGDDKPLIDTIMPPSTGIINGAMLDNADVQDMIQRAKAGVMRSKGNLRKQFPNAEHVKPESKRSGDMNRLMELRKKYNR